jgi:peroxiredoxin
MDQTLLMVAIGLLLLILLSLWTVFYQFIKQQGRLLLRLDNIEQQLGIDGQSVITRGVQLRGAQAEPMGLKVGTPFEPFSLPDLTGQMVSLSGFSGKRVLLVNWSPQCGFCDLIAPDLAKLQTDLQKRNVQLVFVSSSDAEANRKLAEEHGLECPVMLLEESESLKAFEHMGTPVAYLLDEEGRVAQPMAVGAEAVPALAREAASEGKKRKRLASERSLSESKIEREGLKAGTPAPAFSLPDIHGRTVSLEEYRGRKVLLVFSDPHCGPCDELAPDLVRLHQKHHDNGLALIMVGRGDAEENRRKAEARGFEFPVVLQDRWKLSKEYGIFATPVGFLISEQGVIETDVGKGADEILALVSKRLAASQEA